MQRGKLYLSVGEESIVQQLQETYGISELKAVEHVVAQKRELVLLHSLRGNVELAMQLKKELGED